MDPIGDVSYRHFDLRPALKERLEDAPTHLSV
jgi:hypothetical protein